MRKSYAAAILFAVLLSGCFWSSDENDQFHVQVNNNTDDIIFVYYDFSDGMKSMSTSNISFEPSGGAPTARDALAVSHRLRHVQRLEAR